MRFSPSLKIQLSDFILDNVTLTPTSLNITVPIASLLLNLR